MGILFCVVGGLMCILALWAFYRKHQAERMIEDMAGNANLVFQYITALHDFGVDSEVTKQFKIGQRDNPTFLRRAEVFDHVFREKARVTEKVDRIWKGE